MNHMDEVAGLLGLDLFEKFEIKKKFPNICPQKNRMVSNPYYFTDEGMVSCHSGLVTDNRLLAECITGEMVITRLPDDQQNLSCKSYRHRSLGKDELRKLHAGDVVLVTFNRSHRTDVPCMLLPYQHENYLNLAVPSPDGSAAHDSELAYDTLGQIWSARRK